MFISLLKPWRKILYSLLPTAGNIIKNFNYARVTRDVGVGVWGQIEDTCTFVFLKFKDIEKKCL